MSGCVPWDVVIDPACCRTWAQIPEPTRADAVTLAVDTIWALSGRRFGLCEACVRPCKTFCLCCGNDWIRPGMWGVRSGWGPYVNSDGRWVNCGCGCAGSCCKSACAVYLDPFPVHPSGPVVLTIGGVVQDEETYQVIDGRVLVRSSASGCFPECNDLSLPDTEPGTWSVKYLYGIPPPLGALRAAAALACEIAKQCAGQPCRLTGPVTQVSRDGVTLTLDPKAFLDVGLTLLPEVNAWLRQVNPYGLHQPSDVWSPDTAPPSQVTWPIDTC